MSRSVRAKPRFAWAVVGGELAFGGEKEKPAKTSVDIGGFADCPLVSENDTAFKMVEAEGLEPTTH